MASTISVLDSFSTGVDGTSATGGSGTYTPVTDRLSLIVSVAMDQGGGSPNQTLSGCGITWSVLSDGTNSATKLDSASRLRQKVHRLGSGTPAAGQLTIDTGALTCERFALYACEVTQSSNANVIQVVNSGATDANATVTLATPADAANLLVGIFSLSNSNSTFTPGSGVTVLAEVTGEALYRLVVCYAYNQTTLTGTWGVGSSAWCGTAFEIDNVPGSGAKHRVTNSGIITSVVNGGLVS